jgi:cytidylate kinase
MKPGSTPSLDSLIDRQVRLWEVRGRLAEVGGVAARRQLVHLEQGPFLTVSRQIGSGGGEFARAVAERMGWQVYDRAILREIAEHHHLRERVVKRLDEHAVGWISEWVNHLLVPESLPQAAFAKEVAEIVCAVGRQGNAVIVGRGANWLVDPRFGLRVRMIAPLEQRVEEVRRIEGIAEDVAAAKVRAHDVETERYIRRTFGRGVDDPLGYDVVLNAAYVDVGAAVELVCHALRRKLGGD